MSASPSLSHQDRITAMLQLRAWQHVINELIKLGQFKIPIHLAFGYEALALALSCQKQEPDNIVLHHRNIAYQLALVGDLQPILDEFRLLEAGGAGGSLGSMNLAVRGTQVRYTTSILGNGLPVATGLALHQKLYGKDGVTFVTIGDGGIEEGACYEALVFAKSHRLPLVVILENNDQSMSSTIQQRRCAIDWRRFTASLGIDYLSALGSSPEDCDLALGEARQTCLQNSSPVLVEISLHAFNQHAGGSPGWPGDAKDIRLSRGPYLEPLARDPLYQTHALTESEVNQRFMACLAQCDETTRNLLAPLL